MKIRKGVYTIYEGIEMSVTKHYGHGLSQIVDESYRLISYDKKYGSIEDFVFDKRSNMFSKSININELNSAFSVITKAFHKEKIFLVESTTEDEYFILKSDKPFVFEKMGLTIYEVNDEKKVSENELYRKKYFKVFDGYIIRMKIEELEQVWEERSKSEYDLPIPEGLEKKKYIYQNDIF